MSNGAQAAAAGKRARAVPFSPSQGALTSDMASPSDGGLLGLLLDDSMDVADAPEAAQISHSQIIERQAETIARLEAHADRAKEYKTLTKVKLKEAAQRLKDYRLRVEALMGEVETAKSEIKKLETEKKKALAQVQMAKKKQQATVQPAPTAPAAATAPAPVVVVVKKPVTKTVAVQTDAPVTKVMRSMLVQTDKVMKVRTREMVTQTEPDQPKPAVVGDGSAQQTRVVGKVMVASAVVATPQRGDISTARETPTTRSVGKPPVTQQETAVVPQQKKTSTTVASETVVVSKETPMPRPMQKESTLTQVVSKTTTGGPTAAVSFDAISAAIDAELDFSDDEDEGDDGKTSAAKATTVVVEDAVAPPASRSAPVAVTVALPSLLDDAISREIDDELDFGSSSDDSSSSSGGSSSDEERDDGADKANTQEHRVTEEKDALQGTSTVELPAQATRTAERAIDQSSVVDDITAAIDAELASSNSDDDDDEDMVTQVAETTTSAFVGQDGLVPIGMPLPMDSLLEAVAPVADVEMSLTAMPSTVDAISAALDAELASSDDDEDEQDEQEQEQEPQTPDHVTTGLSLATPAPIVADAPSAEDVEMAEIDDECSGDVPQKEATNEIDTRTSTETLSLEAVLREKSRALSLSSDSESSDSSDSSSGASDSGMNDASVGIPSPSEAVQAPTRATIAPVESIWALSMAKTKPTAESIQSAVGDSLLPGKRRVDVSRDQPTEAEPRSKRQKTASPATSSSTPSATAQQTPCSGGDETVAAQAKPTTIETDTVPNPASPSVPEPPPVSIPVPSKRDTQATPTSALPPRVVASFKIATAPQEGEQMDVAYVTRTLGVLIKQVAMFFTRAANGVGFRRDFYARVVQHADALKLCRMLADEYRTRHVATDVLVDGMVRVLRTPRTRNIVDKSLVVLSALFQNLLFRRLQLDTEHAALTLEIHQCLLRLRNLVVAGRLHSGLAMPQSDDSDPASVAAFDAAVASASGASSSLVVKKPPVVGQEVAFLAQIATLYTAICRAIDRSDIARVLLVDLLKCHPNIKGLYGVHAMVQVDPLVLQKRWDHHGRECKSAVRSVAIHVLLVVAASSREKQETVAYKETAATLMSVIADAIDEPQLDPMMDVVHASREHPSESISEFGGTLWRDFIVPNVVATSRIDGDVLDIASALELLGAFYGDATIARHFAVEKFRNLVATDGVVDHEDGAVDASVANGLEPSQQQQQQQQQQTLDVQRVATTVRFVGALHRGVLRSTTSASLANRDVTFAGVVDAVRWILDTWLSGDASEELGAEEMDSELLDDTVVAELTQLLVGMSTQQLEHQKLRQWRDTTLHQLLHRLTPMRLTALSSATLRQLRLLVMATRPLI